MVQDLGRLGKAADAEAVHMPAAGAVANDIGAERAQDRGSVAHVFAFQQVFDDRLTNGKGAQDQSAVRYRLVARDANAAFQRACGTGGERRKGRSVGHAGIA